LSSWSNTSIKFCLKLRKIATKLDKMLKYAMEMLVYLIHVFKGLKRFGKGHEDPEADPRRGQPPNV